ncbi:MAG TPA: tetratricopeptide repeat protein [Rubricoccaceae bacterium]|nr:tetratricopeptide repeat protein [Rubricoccaceae bacterium]
MLRSFPLLSALLLAAVLVAGADGCSSDPNVEGARLYMRSNDHDAALRSLETALQSNPDNVEALQLKAEVLRQKTERTTDPAARGALATEMVAAIERARQLAPDNADVRTTWQNVYVTEMNYGVGQLRRSAEDAAAARAAIAAFQNVTRIAPDSAGGHFNLGLAYLVGDDADQAIDPLQRSIDLGGADANAYLYLGRALIATQQGDRAIALLEQGVQAFPANEALQAELLNAYSASGQTDRSIAAYEAAIQRNPDNALYRYNYGSMLLQAERYDEAVEQLERAVAIDATNPDAFYNLGAAYQNKAAALSRQMNETTDEARAAQLRTERDDLLRQALPHLLQARRLTEAAGGEVQSVCRALFQVHTTLAQIEEAREAAACGGMDTN